MWLDGTAYWAGIQMDECAFPILLADWRSRDGAHRSDASVGAFWPMVERAAGFIVRNGPVTSRIAGRRTPATARSRWRSRSPRCLPPPICADDAGDNEAADYLRDTADAWNASIERWIYVHGQRLCAALGVDGYYVRIAPPDRADAASPRDGFVPIKNRPPARAACRRRQIVSPDALALVRFGLRAPTTRGS